MNKKYFLSPTNRVASARASRDRMCRRRALPDRLGSTPYFSEWLYEPKLSPNYFEARFHLVSSCNFQSASEYYFERSSNIARCSMARNKITNAAGTNLDKDVHCPTTLRDLELAAF